MQKAIFITVRTNSTRLPQKCLLKFAGKTVIVRLIERVKRSKLADGIVLCTTMSQQDDVLAEIAAGQGVSFFRGSEEDKLERWRGAAEKFGVEFFVTADGDDLFCEPELIDLAFKQYEEGKADFIEGLDIPCGAFTYGVKVSALKKVCQIKDTHETEMMWVYFKETGLFKLEELKGIPEVFRKPEIRMTLDYEDDFRFFKNIIEYFAGQGKEAFGLRDVLIYLEAHPEVVKINQHRQKEFLENQKRKTKLVLKAEK